MGKLGIAVIGSGIAGLSAAWLLSQRHTVTLIESEPQLGGHAKTVDVPVKGNGSVAIDTGFIVSNAWTYPNFSALVDYLGVDMVDIAMTFSVSADQGRYEYSGNHLGTLCGKPRMWLSPRHWQMMTDLWHFYRTAEHAAAGVSPHLTLGQYLANGGYGATFIRRHILPMAGAIWSSTPDQIAAFPFRAFVDFFSNHQLFVLGNRPDWRSVKGGSRSYVEKLVADGRFSIRTASPVVRVFRKQDGVDVHFANGGSENFDHVVIATHGDQALRLLGNPTSDETAVLSHFKTSLNRVVLHRDSAPMPGARRFWSGWNYRAVDQGRENALSVTYWMNALQKLDSPEDHFVSLNPCVEPAPAKVDGTYYYRHPVFNAATLGAQQELWNLQGVRRTWFAGAWFGAGFHEDGIQAGLAVAEQLGGAARPWAVANESGRIHVRDPLPPITTTFADAAE